MKIIKFLAAGVISLAAVTGNAATIWQPTDVNDDGDVNILQIEYQDLFVLNGGELALFQDTDTGMLNPLALGSDGGKFKFTENTDGTFTVVAISGGVTQGNIIMDGYEFTLGVSWDMGTTYAGDSSYSQDEGELTSYYISFTDASGKTGSAIAIDLQPVPLPAAAWLFGSALLGFVGVSRRTKA